MKRLLMAWASLVLLGACVATTPRIDEPRLRDVRAGATSYPEIVKHFGPTLPASADVGKKRTDGSFMFQWPGK